MAQDNYVMGRTAEEYARLRQQARLWQSATREALERVGLKGGMRCLDVGCGPGEVMRLMAEIAGPDAHVTGVDQDAALANQALAMLKAEVPGHFAFHEHDAAGPAPIPGGPYDVVFGRFIVIHMTDPLPLLRKMMAAVKPGGVVLVQDYNLELFEVQPRPKSWNVLRRFLIDVFEKAGKDPRTGSKLGPLVVAAGIGAPDGLLAHARTATMQESGWEVTAVVRSLLPVAVKFGLVTQSEGEACLTELEEIIASGTYAVYQPPVMLSAWKRKAS